MLEQGELPGQADERLARLGRPHGLRPLQHDPADALFEGPDALAHGAGRDAELRGGPLERARVDRGGECAQAVERQLHALSVDEATLHRLQDRSLDCIVSAP